MQVLDIGCGIRSIYPEATHCLDWSCNDPCRLKLLQEATNKLGKQYIDWDIKNLPLPFTDNYFDKVRLMHVFEHLIRTDAERLIKDLHRILISNGTIIIGVPDILWLAKQIVINPNLEDILPGTGAPALDYLYGCAEKLTCTCCKKDLGLHVHKCGYTPLTLQNLLKRNGFEIIEVRQNIDVDLYVSARKI